MYSEFLLGLVLFASHESCIDASTNDVTPIFVFGESLYDPGNNDYLNISDYKANFPPYGETFFRYPTGRFCDGRQVSDFLAMDAELPVWSPYLQPGYHNFSNGANFASAGGAVLDGVNNETLSLRIQLGKLKQVSSFLKSELGVAAEKMILKNAIYLISMGGVDYFSFYDLYPDSTEGEIEEYVEMVVGNLTEAVKEIHKMGGRKFAFQNVGQLGCTPRERQANDGSCAELLQVLARKHNKALSKSINELESELSGLKYSIFDYYTSLADIIENPTKYGFKEGKVACCGEGSYRGVDCGIGTYELCTDPNEYVFFDGNHPSEACNVQLAELFWNGSTDVPGPLNFKQLYELDLEDSNLNEDDGNCLLTDE